MSSIDKKTACLPALAASSNGSRRSSRKASCSFTCEVDPNHLDLLVPLAHEQIFILPFIEKPVLKVHFLIVASIADELQLFHPDGTPFFSFAEINQILEQSECRAEQAHQRAEQSERRTAEIEVLLQQYRDRFGNLDTP